MRLQVGSFMTSAVVASTMAAGTANALPLGDASDALAQRAPLALAMDGVDFSAILALNNCSGSLVRFTTSSPEDKAMALTNGHCHEGGFLSPGEVLVNEDSHRSFELLNAQASDSLGTLRAETILYATMTDTDVTLYRLTESYAEIESRYGVKPLTIADKHPQQGTAIHIVSGYWKRIYACSVDRFVYSLKEGDWLFRDSIRYSPSGCSVIGGTSGSPIIGDDSHQVIGINNTTNEYGERCTENNPCEVDEQGAVTVKKGAGYGQEIYQFYGCLNGSREIDLTIAGCALPKPSSVKVPSAQ